jgi:hypothetical protein
VTSLRVRRNWDFITRRTPLPATQATPSETAQPTLNFTRPGRTTTSPPAEAPAAPLNFARQGATPSGAPLRIGTAPVAASSPTVVSRAPQQVPPPAADAPTLDARKAALTDRDPVIRLTRLQSAIGALRIDGAADIGWHATDNAHGVSILGTSLRGGPVHANRPLVERVARDQLLVNLRHVHELRRLVVTAADESVTVTTAGGSVITAPGTIYIHIIGGVIELRHEPGAAVADFGFTV